MAYFYILLTTFALSLSGVADVPHADLDKAFNANDAAAVVSFSKDKVLMNVLGSEGAFSQPQAKLILRDFFTKHPKGKFSFIFKGRASDNGSFSIGNYVVKDETFRVTFHFKKDGAQYRIETLNIEK